MTSRAIVNQFFIPQLANMLTNLIFLAVFSWNFKVIHTAETLCSLPPITYASAKEMYPDSAFALSHLETLGIATWYTDRDDSGDVTQTAMDLVVACPESSRLSIVVYGLPNKDCDAGYSSGEGTVKTSADYKEFISNLAFVIEKRKVLYVLEPDAIGLLASNECAVKFGYEKNLITAIKLLSKNPNAEIYLDVGFWALQRSNTTNIVTKTVKKLAKTGRVKGIALNTSNYRATEEIAKLCTAFQTAMGSTNLHCVIDSSRNFQEFVNESSSEWCNVRKAGIGAPPTNVTNLDGIDYFLYLKPPGDSDGTCLDESMDALPGPQAGQFFNEHFIKLWNQGYFVSTQQMDTIDDPESSASPLTWHTMTWMWIFAASSLLSIIASF
ncbi:glycoside hydrolase family 6 protein [Plasmopara halstedii]|uniref:Glycoside hydrolase family 6 protein n=1 Tax=Plasmopara halstedii TaxID=4781 RepID=A0A0P1AWX8_PLAHL|nr:glycoside hydrolase family 6 protein [Plasmopara halstedii]CEG46937.1 glycoside hydrolase family 6 protein [Plasmopara halstedii]|eukprot:XP_024583306.1 glycoside hydrolase family 6 protein [Plasmopara halstedii]